MRLLLLLLAGCGGGLSNERPPRAPEAELAPPQTSVVAIPVEADLDRLEQQLNDRVPTRILSVDERRKRCLPRAKLKFGCHLVGHVTRGRIRLAGRGDVLRLTMPLAAEIEARDILGFIGTNEATGRATVTADVRLALTPDWIPKPKVAIRYRWQEEPGVRLARWRITFTKEADRELAKVIAGLEAEIPRLVAEAQPRRQMEEAWRQIHTSIELNRVNPAVWMRITPKGFGTAGYEVDGRTLRLHLLFEAGSETFVGTRPPDPPPTPLPPLAERKGAPGFRLVIPVVADWAILERELEKALARLAKKGVLIDGIGRVAVSFGRPTLYATEGGRVAVGLDLAARSPRGLVDTRGRVWLTARVGNAPDSRALTVSDLRVSGTIEGVEGRLLMAIAQSAPVRAAIADALATSFERDFTKLLGKIDRALTDKRVGPFILNAKVTETHNGVIRPLGQGAFLLVEASGQADLRWAPADAPRRARA